MQQYSVNKSAQIILPTRSIHLVLQPLLHEFPEYIASFTISDTYSLITVTSRIATEYILQKMNSEFTGYAILSNIPENASFDEVEFVLSKNQIEVEEVSTKLSFGGYIVKISQFSFNRINELYIQVNLFENGPIVAISTATNKSENYLKIEKLKNQQLQQQMEEKEIGFRRSKGALTQLSNGEQYRGFRTWRTTEKCRGVSVLQE